jgi:hypothetical protein
MRLAAAALAAAMIVAPAALAQPAPDPGRAAATAPDMAVFQPWLEKQAAWTQNAQAVVAENAEAMMAVVDGAEKIIDLLDAEDIKGARAWFKPWSAAQRARLAALKARADDLPPPPVPPAEFARASGFDGSTSADAARAIATLSANTAAMGDRYVDLIGKAAQGSDDALLPLAALTFDATIAGLRGENAVSEFSVGTINARHPSAALVRAGINFNDAMIGLLSMQRDQLLDEDYEMAPHLARIRASLAKGKAAAEDIAPAAARFRTTNPNPAPAEAAMAGRVAAAMATFDESAAVELELIERANMVLAALEAGETFESESITGAMSAVETLVNRRHAIDNTRREIIAGRH